MITTNTRLDVGTRNSIKGRIDNLLSYVAATNPYPFTTDDAIPMYASCIGEELHAKMVELGTIEPNAVHMSATYQIRVPTHRSVARLHLNFGTLCPILEVGWSGKPPILPATSKYYERMVEWASECHKLDAQRSVIGTFVSDIVGQLGTYGQLLRLWPSIAQWLPDKEKLSASSNQQRKSSLPQEFQLRLPSRDDSSRGQFSVWQVRAEIALVDEYLAKAALLMTVNNGKLDVGMRMDPWA